MFSYTDYFFFYYLPSLLVSFVIAYCLLCFTLCDLCAAVYLFVVFFSAMFVCFYASYVPYSGTAGEGREQEQERGCSKMGYKERTVFMFFFSLLYLCFMLWAERLSLCVPLTVLYN